MEWDEEAARGAVSAFSAIFKELEVSHPECVRRLCAAWKESYLRCGHRRLGRILLGYSPEAACKVRTAKE
jgi:hypothetical protein